jgi:hypothetical protein
MTVVRLSTVKWSLVSAVIRWRSECDQSHAEFEFEDGSTLGARFSLRGKIARWLGWPKRWQYLDGVQLRPASANRKQSKIIRLTFDRIEEAAVWFRLNRLGAPYDLLGIVGIGTARGWDDSHDNFCSEGIHESAMAVGTVLQDCASQAVLPRDIKISPNKRFVG